MYTYIVSNINHIVQIGGANEKGEGVVCEKLKLISNVKFGKRSLSLSSEKNCAGSSSNFGKAGKLESIH